MSSNLTKIAKLLSNREYIDGTTIGNTLNITRAAVWKYIKKLEDYGIKIESVKGKGYILVEPLVLLDQESIRSALNKKKFHIEILEKIDSTNSYLKKSILEKENIRIAIAEMQTQGRGRLNRNWYAPFGKNINLSLSYPFQKDISELSGLSLIIGLSVCRAINNVCKLQEKLYVKWPNDIVCNGKKMAGILIEIQAESHGACNVIIGIGLNVNMSNASKKNINQKWTSLYQLTGEYQNRNFICAEIIEQMFIYLGRFLDSGLHNFINEWNDKDYLFEKTLNVKSGDNIFEGIGSGINEQGHLLLKSSANKQIRSFSSGDTTLLK